jgi:ATP-dependent DNA helicase RecG
VVSLPFNRIDGDVVDDLADNVVDKLNELNETQQKILMGIRNNPNITQPQLAILVGVGKTAVQNNIVVLKRKGFIERVGSNKSGYWEVLE